MRIARTGSIAIAGSLKTFMINKRTLNSTEKIIPHSNVVFTPASLVAVPDTFKMTGTITGGFFDTDITALTGCTVTFTAHLAKQP